MVNDLCHAEFEENCFSTRTCKKLVKNKTTKHARNRFFLSDCLTSLQLPLNTNVLYSQKIEIDSFLLILWTVLHSCPNYLVGKIKMKEITIHSVDHKENNQQSTFEG